MTVAPAIHVGHLPNLVSGTRGTLWWGMLMLIVIESAVFGTMIASYLYLRMLAPEWPPAGIGPPDLGLATVNTVVLLASSISMYLADSGIVKGNQRRLVGGMAAAALLGAIFLVLKVVEYADVPYRWDDHAYGSIVWLIVGFHSAHVASVVLKTIVVGLLGRWGYFDERRHLGVQINGLYWHFVVAVWVPLYVLLYWVPRM